MKRDSQPENHNAMRQALCAMHITTYTYTVRTDICHLPAPLAPARQTTSFGRAKYPLRGLLASDISVGQAGLPTGR